MKKFLELLAPAGTWEALEAAVNAGADAVYLGGKAFGARAYADNFDRDELSRAVRFAHLHGARLFVTVNTLADDREMRELADYLAFLSNAGVDAIIVQDLGVLRLARLVASELPRHASTQMTITNSAGARFAADCGMVRAVPARELSLADSCIATFSEANWKAWLSASDSISCMLDLKLPSIKLDYKSDIIPTFQKMGIHDAFNANCADFSRMTDMPAYISEIEQFTRLEVTETGTVAAAATITNVVLESEIVPEITPYPFHVNRPFLLVIHENKTGLILFMGKMMDIL